MPLSYDEVSQLTEAKLTLPDATSTEVAYRYDAAGNRTLTQAPGASTTYKHNEINQITTASGGLNTAVKGFLSEPAQLTVNGKAVRVGAGNIFAAQAEPDVANPGRLTLTATDYSGVSTTQAWNTIGGTTTASQSFECDKSGNLLFDPVGNRRYEWDGLNRMKSVTLASGQKYIFTHGAEGQISSIADSVNAASKKYLIWSGGRVVQERNASNQITKRFYAQGFQTIDSQSTASSYYYTRDHLGSIREVVDSTGAVRARYDYDPYGKRSSNLITTNPVEADSGYTGHYYFPPAQLHLAFYMAYDSELGRWLSRDPVGEAGGLNLYGYVLNDPVNLVDPHGETPMLAGAVLGGVVGGVVGGGLSIASDLWNERSVNWGNAGSSAAKGAIGGAIAGATFGLVAPAAGSLAMAAVNQGASRAVATAAGVCSGAISGAAGNLAAQGAAIGMGWQDCFSGSELAAATVFGGAFGALGREFNVGNGRVAPFGNRVSNPNGTLPHYHRGVPKPNNPAQNLPGQNMKRHRPWDTHASNRSFWDRF